MHKAVKKEIVETYQTMTRICVVYGLLLEWTRSWQDTGDQCSPCLTPFPALRSGCSLRPMSRGPCGWHTVPRRQWRGGTHVSLSRRKGCFSRLFLAALTLCGLRASPQSDLGAISPTVPTVPLKGKKERERERNRNQFLPLNPELSLHLWQVLQASLGTLLLEPASPLTSLN